MAEYNKKKTIVTGHKGSGYGSCLPGHLTCLSEASDDRRDHGAA